MKEVEKKDEPEVSGGAWVPPIPRTPIPRTPITEDPDYPQSPVPDSPWESQ